MYNNSFVFRPYVFCIIECVCVSILFLLPKLSLCEALAWGQVFTGGRLWKTLLPPDELLKIPERLKRCGNWFYSPAWEL